MQLLNDVTSKSSFPGLKLGIRYGGVLLGLVCIVFAAIALVSHNGVQDLQEVVTKLPAGLAISAGVHLPQIVFTALAWRCLLSPDIRPSIGSMTVVRWLRESANTLLPAGAIVGQVAAARLLTRWGVPGTLAAATATVDVTMESVSQALFTLVGLGLLIAGDSKTDLLGVAVSGAVLGVAGIGALIAIQGGTSLRWLENLLTSRFPTLKPDTFRNFRLKMLELRAARGSLARAILCHSTAWVLGCLEISGVLALLHHPVSFSSAFIVESLSQAMRIAGFMLPGAFAVQEGAILAAAALVGVPAETALFVALVRRTRELVVSLIGLLAWAGVERADTRKQLLATDQGT